MKRIVILATCAATIAALGVPGTASAKKNPYSAYKSRWEHCG
jgi:hypothetical protein